MQKHRASRWSPMLCTQWKGALHSLPLKMRKVRWYFSIPVFRYSLGVWIKGYVVLYVNRPSPYFIVPWSTSLYNLMPRFIKIFHLRNRVWPLTSILSSVARKILEMKEHKVELGECTITLEAKPVQVLVPSLVEVPGPTHSHSGLGGRGSSALVLQAHCPGWSRCFPAPTHLVQMNGSLWSSAEAW